MRIQHILAVSASVFAFACGDDGGSGGDDSADDAAPMDMAAACDIPASLTGLDGGTMAMPVSGDWFVRPTTGQLMGRTLFSVDAVLPGGSASSQDQFSFGALKPNTGTMMFPLNTAIPFGQGGAVFAVYANLSQANPNPSQIYLANSGSITLTAIGEANGSPINGTVSATTLVEINQMTNMPVAGGCTATVAPFSFFLTQMAGKEGVIPTTPSVVPFLEKAAQ